MDGKMMTEERNQEELRQEEFLKKAAEAVEKISESHGHKKMKSCVVTFGCQMNARDSEKLRGILLAAGFEDTEEEEEADFIIYNTCTVRENADQHVYGRLGRLTGLKKKNPELIVGLCGCMMQEPEIVKKIRRSYPVVDLIFGTHNLFTFPELLSRILTEKKRVIELWEGTDEIIENLPIKRKYAFKSGVNIMFGCNNFCSYCIVPYVRGRERSRRPEDILDEIRRLAEDGVKEIMLLGQNVNSYGKNLETPMSFASLLKQVADIEGIERIRFMTSHPKDLSDELIEAFNYSDKICRHLHLPVQSGSTEILQKMNRHYTREDYLTLVKKIRAAVPDISLTTDLIVGFPGETEEDAQATVSLVREVGYDSAFTFIYSKRTGTPAAKMENQIPEDVVHARFDRLLSAVKETGEKASSRFTGRTMDVLVEEKNKMDGYVTGRTSHNLTVHLPGCENDIGKLVPVRLTDCRGFYYFGERV
ncbi:MAG: tRNA (N6-isopentenyl adenosine(37)-C2)-methylthiotransferase MiaB [Lachnospiraceae bacterium]|nr:tRNA (N6-isopentenyl adenosine(37)-C2)-methylthiotransferase MiaB [Lachnospiraceae bacterium]